MTEITTMARRISATTFSTTSAASFVASMRGTSAQPGFDLPAVGVSAHQVSGSWRGIGQVGCPSMSLRGVTQITPVAAGRSVRPVAEVRAYAAPAAAQLKRQMINRNGKNGTKGSSPWRFPV